MVYNNVDLLYIIRMLYILYMPCVTTLIRRVLINAIVICLPSLTAVFCCIILRLKCNLKLLYMTNVIRKLII